MSPTVGCIAKLAACGLVNDDPRDFGLGWVYMLGLIGGMLRVVMIDIDKRSKQRSYPTNVLGKTQKPMSAVVVSP